MSALYVERRSKKHKEKLAALREALQADAALGDEDLRSALQSPDMSEPVLTSKQQLESEVHTRKHSSPAAQASYHRAPETPQHTNKRDVGSAAAAEQDTESLASEASDDDLSEDAMLARLIQVQQGGAGPRSSQDDDDDGDDEGSGGWEQVPADPIELDNALAEDFEDVHIVPDPAQHHQAEPEEDVDGGARPAAGDTITQLCALRCKSSCPCQSLGRLGQVMQACDVHQ